MRVQIGNVYSTLEGSSREINRARKLLTAYAPGFRYTSAYKRKRWDGKVCLLKEEQVPTGLVPYLASNISCKLIDQRPVINISPRETNVPLRPYQRDASLAALRNTFRGAWWPRGVLQIATGGGKTYTAAAMIQMTQVPTLFLTHRRDLVDQTYREFVSLGLQPGVFKKGEVEGSDSLVISTVQSLMSWKTHPHTSSSKQEAYIRSLLGSFQQVFVDEAHLIAASLDKGNLFFSALALAPNALMRWGLTGTAFMREAYHDWLLEGATGQRLCEISARELIEAGYLAKPNIYMIRTKPLKIPDKWPICYELGIVMNSSRNDKIAEVVRASTGPTMVLVSSLAHGDTLYSMLSQHKAIGWLRGEDKAEDRRATVDRLRSGELDCLIASRIYDEGIDIREIETLVLAGAGRSVVKTIQRLGRALRRTKEKSEVEVFDFLDEACPILKRHAIERRKVWVREGHEVFIR